MNTYADSYENFQEFLRQARERSAQWAKELLSRDPSTWVILDTETTGLGPGDEVVQIAIIDGAGNVLINNVLVKPTVSISEGARGVHGITEEMIASAPRFLEVLPAIRDAVHGKVVVIYNASFDISLLTQSARASGERLAFQAAQYDDAMLYYAEWFGQWNDYHGSFRWQRLVGGEHSALGDCRAVLQLIRKMAGAEDGSQALASREMQ